MDHYSRIPNCSELMYVSLCHVRPLGPFLCMYKYVDILAAFSLPWVQLIPYDVDVVVVIVIFFPTNMASINIM